MMSKIYMKDLYTGKIIIADGGFTCMGEGLKTVMQSPNGFYVECNGDHDDPDLHCHHYLDGQVDEPGGEIIGFSVIGD